MISLLHKFNANSVLTDANSALVGGYYKDVYWDDTYTYFLENSAGDVLRYDTLNETFSALTKKSTTEFTSTYTNFNILTGKRYDYPLSAVYFNSNEPVNSIIKYQDNLHGFKGTNIKQFVDDTVLYLYNNQLIQESYDRVLNITHLSTGTAINDFIVDEDYNYFVIHNKSRITKFSKDRIATYSRKVNTLTNVVSGLGIQAGDTIELLKMDIVREYTNDGMKTYPIVLGKVLNGTSTLSGNSLFLAAIDETATTDDTFLSRLVALPIVYKESDLKTKYNLTNYDYLKNKYTETDNLVFVCVLHNIFNNKDKITVEIPISKKYFESEVHHFAFRLDGLEGFIGVFCDGIEIASVNIPKGEYAFQDLLSDSISVGNTYFFNRFTLDKHLNQNNYYYINNATISKFKMYNRALKNTEIEFNVMEGLNMQDLVVSLPCDQRNELDGIERHFKLDSAGSKSNKVNIIVKNSQITNTLLQSRLKTILEDKLKKILPITTTINEIDFR